MRGALDLQITEKNGFLLFAPIATQWLAWAADHDDHIHDYDSGYSQNHDHDVFDHVSDYLDCCDNDAHDHYDYDDNLN